jgi:hypothetical protein
MADGGAGQHETAPHQPGAESPRSRLGRILQEHPEARPRLGEAIGSLLKVVLATLAIIGLLAIWHLRRRARMIRDRIGPHPPGGRGS